MYVGAMMQVPWYRRDGWARLRFAVGLAVGVTSAWGAAPRGPQPVLKLKLAELGFPGIPQALMDVGASMVTAHYVDGTHLLVTFSLRELVERIPDDPPEDDDRAVAAVLLELPTGKVLARTRWHLHDHAQYLWNVGRGRFLLRTGNARETKLTAIAPLENLAGGDAFRQMGFVRVRGKLDDLVVSPDFEVVTVESSPLREQGMRRLTEAERPDETFAFLRVVGTGSAENPVKAAAAGMVRSRDLGALPLNGRGYLVAEGGKRGRWAMSFQGFDGETRKLGDVDSSCPPVMQFLGPAEFLAMSCRGSADSMVAKVFDFAPHEIWEEPMGGTLPLDQFANAEAAGRFAVSLLVPQSGGATAVPTTGLTAATAQEVRVYQTESGDLLLKVVVTPTSRTGQNFDLSPDGRSLVVLREGAIEVYALPALSAGDAKDLAEVRGFAPAVPVKEREISLKRLMVRSVEEGVREEVEEKPAAVAAPVADGAAADAAVANEGDVQTVRRKPPSLVGPGEAAAPKF